MQLMLCKKNVKEEEGLVVRKVAKEMGAIYMCDDAMMPYNPSVFLIEGGKKGKERMTGIEQMNCSHDNGSHRVRIEV